MAESLLRRALEVRGVAGRVRSAGIAFDDRPASGGSVKAMAARGLDLTDHRSCIMTAEVIRSADLVVAMARSHVREAAVLAPDRFNRMFTLKELVRRGATVGPRRQQPLDQWLDRLALGRDAVTFLGDSPDDDVSDPIGQSQKVYDATAVELDQLVRHMADLVWGPAGRVEATG